jgi:hypothetical protein
MADDDGLTRYERAHLNLLAGIEHQLTRIADGAAEPDTHLAYEQVQEAWTSVLPMYEDKAVPFLQRLGITVD